jgi:hypothetical protein
VPDILERQLHYAAKDSDNFLDAAQNARLIASAERYYRVMYFGARNLGSAAYPYVRDTLGHILDSSRCSYSRRPFAGIRRLRPTCAAALPPPSSPVLPWISCLIALAQDSIAMAGVFVPFIPIQVVVQQAPAEPIPERSRTENRISWTKAWPARENFSKWAIPSPTETPWNGAHSSLSNIFERQPLVLGAIGLAIGAAVAGAFETSDRE